MNFYTINYIQSHQNTDRTALYILMIVAASAMIIFTILYLRDRFNTRYRDLGIIALLFLVLFAGTQYEKYIQNNGKNQRLLKLFLLLSQLQTMQMLRKAM